MRIANNISAMNTHRTLLNSDNSMSKSMERLSSGYRINKAADDAAGLAISEKMRAQVKGLNQASRNAQDGISMIQTAEGGLNEMHSILQRMRELAVQAGNDTLTASDKDEIQKEITQLVDEVDRISGDTEFNTKKLLNGSAGVSASALNTDVDTTSGSVTKGGVGVVDGTDITGAVTIKTGSATDNGVYAVNVSQTASAAKLSGGAAPVNLTGAGTLNINGTSVDLANGDDIATVMTKINNVTKDTGVTASLNGGNLRLSSEELGSNVTISIQGENQLLDDLGLIDNADATTTALTDAGEDAIATMGGVAMQASGNVLKDEASGIEITLDDDLVVTGGATMAFDAAVDPNGEVTLQIGANSNQTIKFSISNMDTNSLDIDDLDVTTDAAGALDKIDDALNAVSAERSKLGAYQNRLEHTISNLGVSAENISASESRVRDVDMAAEMTQFTKNQILSQAATSMLAQANQKSQSVLKLLG